MLVICMSTGLGKMQSKCCEGADLAVGRADGLCGSYHSDGIPVVYETARGCVVGSCSQAVGELVCLCSLLPASSVGLACHLGPFC